MKLRRDLAFYSIWPLFGERLGNQWEEIRQNQATINPIAKGALVYEDDVPDPDPNPDITLAGFEFGEQEFPNKFRNFWEEENERFQFDVNVGTTDNPDWETAFYIISNQIVFSKQANFLKGGGALTVREADGSPTVSNVSTILVSNDTLVDDGSGQVTIITGEAAGNVTFKDGTHVITDDTISFSGNDFYLDTDSDGSPKLNLFRKGFVLEQRITSPTSEVFFYIPQTATGLILESNIRSNRNADNDFIQLRVNGDTGSNYMNLRTQTSDDNTQLTAYNGSTTSFSISIAPGDTADDGFGFSRIHFGDYSRSVVGGHFARGYGGMLQGVSNPAGSRAFTYQFNGSWKQSEPIRELRVYSGFGAEMVAGSFIKVIGE